MIGLVIWPPHEPKTQRRRSDGGSGKSARRVGLTQLSPAIGVFNIGGERLYDSMRRASPSVGPHSRSCLEGREGAGSTLASCDVYEYTSNERSACTALHLQSAYHSLSIAEHSLSIVFSRTPPHPRTPSRMRIADCVRAHGSLVTTRHRAGLGLSRGPYGEGA